MFYKKKKDRPASLADRMPKTLNDITIGQLMALQEKPALNDLEAISILADIPLMELQNIANLDDLYALTLPVLALSEEIKYLYTADLMPKCITFQLPGGCKIVKVTHNLSVEPVGAFMAARDIIADEISEQVNLYGPDDWRDHYNPSLKTCCQVLAHYFYCRATGKPYNEYEASEFIAEIKKLRVTEALPIAMHFFTCYPNLWKQKTNYWRLLLPRWRKKPAYRLSKNSSISIP